MKKLLSNCLTDFDLSNIGRSYKPEAKFFVFVRRKYFKHPMPLEIGRFCTKYDKFFIAKDKDEYIDCESENGYKGNPEDFFQKSVKEFIDSKNPTDNDILILMRDGVASGYTVYTEAVEFFIANHINRILEKFDGTILNGFDNNLGSKGTKLIPDGFGVFLNGNILPIFNRYNVECITSYLTEDKRGRLILSKLNSDFDAKSLVSIIPSYRHGESTVLEYNNISNSMICCYGSNHCNNTGYEYMIGYIDLYPESKSDSFFYSSGISINVEGEKPHFEKVVDCEDFHKFVDSLTNKAKPFFLREPSYYRDKELGGVYRITILAQLKNGIVIPIRDNKIIRSEIKMICGDIMTSRDSDKRFGVVTVIPKYKTIWSVVQTYNEMLDVPDELKIVRYIVV